ncbi:putative extensin-2-like 5 [Homarus americanus]|uniref:Putative extensin-2-like 5 n=1 Tax=Homarus americanus TaxID=6706 RepID=A0A8J5N365_HOMAM|nr:putative extensin-2-like 5 [Homarus americanus]
MSEITLKVLLYRLPTCNPVGVPFFLHVIGRYPQANLPYTQAESSPGSKAESISAQKGTSPSPGAESHRMESYSLLWEEPVSWVELTLSSRRILLRIPTVLWAESHPYSGTNPTVFRDGILPHSRLTTTVIKESYLFWGKNPTVFWDGILLSSGANPTPAFGDGILPHSEAESYRSRAESYRLRDGILMSSGGVNLPLFWDGILPYSGGMLLSPGRIHCILRRNRTFLGRTYRILGETYTIMGRHPTLFWGGLYRFWHRILPSSGGRESHCLGGGILPDFRRNPLFCRILLILPFSGTGILLRNISGAESAYFGTESCYSDAEAYRLLGQNLSVLEQNPTPSPEGQNPTVFLENSTSCWSGTLPYSGAESYRLLGRNPTVFWGGIVPYSVAESYILLGQNSTLIWDGTLPSSKAESYRLLQRNPTVSWSRLLPRNPTLVWGGTLPYSGAESYRILGQNPTLFWDGILPFSEIESYRILRRNPTASCSGTYRLLRRNPTVFWGGILPSSGVESYRILRRNPSVSWSGILPYSEAKSYRLLGQNPTVF